MGLGQQMEPRMVNYERFEESRLKHLVELSESIETPPKYFHSVARHALPELVKEVLALRMLLFSATPVTSARSLGPRDGYGCVGCLAHEGEPHKLGCRWVASKEALGERPAPFVAR